MGTGCARTEHRFLKSSGGPGAADTGPHRVGLAVTVTRVRAVPPRGAFFHTRVGPSFSKGHAPARARGAGSDAAGPHGGTTRNIDGTPAAAYTG